MAKFASRVIIDRVRYLVLAVSLFACASAQVHEVSAELPVGTISARLMLTLPSVPYAKDSISVDCSSGRVRFAVVTPDGRRINAENASAAGFDWSESSLETPDWGKSVRITFRSDGEAGNYVIEVSGETTRAATAKAYFFSPVRSHESILRRTFPDAIVSQSVAASETIEFAVAEDEGRSVMDVLVSLIPPSRWR